MVYRTWRALKAREDLGIRGGRRIMGVRAARVPGVARKEDLEVLEVLEGPVGLVLVGLELVELEVLEELEEKVLATSISLGWVAPVGLLELAKALLQTTTRSKTSTKSMKSLSSSPPKAPLPPPVVATTAPRATTPTAPEQTTPAPK